MDRDKLIELFEKNPLFLEICIKSIREINKNFDTCDYEIIATELLNEFDEYEISEMLVDARDYLFI